MHLSNQDDPRHGTMRQEQAQKSPTCSIFVHPLWGWASNTCIINHNINCTYLGRYIISYGIVERIPMSMRELSYQISKCSAHVGSIWDSREGSTVTILDRCIATMFEEVVHGWNMGMNSGLLRMLWLRYTCINPRHHLKFRYIFEFECMYPNRSCSRTSMSNTLRVQKIFIFTLMFH